MSKKKNSTSKSDRSDDVKTLNSNSSNDSTKIRSKENIGNLLQKCDPVVSECVEAELETLSRLMALTPKKQDTLICKVCQRVCVCKSTDNESSCNDDSQIPREVLYFGWFFSESTGLSLKTFAEELLRTLIARPECQNIRDFFDTACSGKDPISVYRKPASSKKYHCTAKFCDRKLCEDYENKARNFVGKTCDINIVGLCITNSTFGYRIELDDVQLQLFDNERERQGSKALKEDEACLEKSFSEMSLKPKHTKCRKKSTSISAVVDSRFTGLVFIPQVFKDQPSTTRAHITIGCNKGIPAKQTGEDLLDIIDLETRANSSSSSILVKDCCIEDVENNLMSCTVREFVREAIVIHAKYKIVCRAVFEGVA